MFWGLLCKIFAPVEWLGGLVGLPWWLCWALGILVPYYIYATWTFGRWKEVGIKGPRPVPMLGTFWLMMKGGLAKDPEHAKRWGKIYGSFAARTPCLVVNDPAVVKEIGIRQFDAFTNRLTQGFPIQRELRGAFSLKENEEWKGARNVITPTFSAAKMRRIAQIVSACGEDFVAALTKASTDSPAEIDIKAYAGNFTMDAVGRTLFGIEANCQEDLNNPFVTNAKRVFEINFTSPRLLAMLFFPAAIIKPIFEALNWGTMDPDVAAFFRRQVTSILAMRRESSQKTQHHDFIQLLLEAHEAEMEKEEAGISAFETTKETYEQVKNWRVGKRPLSEEEILGNAIVFMIVGYETTASALSWMLHLLAFHPDAQEQLYQEIAKKMAETGGRIGYEEVAASAMPFMDQVFCETLRLYPSALRSDRVCNTDTSIGDGIAVRKGELINFGIYAIHHDEDYWPDPEAFKPERFAPENRDSIVPYSWLPFGLGPRNCIGMRLAMMEAKIGAAYALKAFRFAPGPSSELRPELGKTGFAAPAKKTLPIRVVKRAA